MHQARDPCQRADSLIGLEAEIRESQRDPDEREAALVAESMRYVATTSGSIASVKHRNATGMTQMLDRAECQLFRSQCGA